jgi:proline iminopeptidase
MKSNRLSFSIVLLGIFFALVAAPMCSADEEISLWPAIEPYESGYIKVSGIHEIYYEACGNKQGRPVFMLHGGPGGSSSPYMRRFCDPEKFHIILYDQRGAGKSRPSGVIEENTTQLLVEDIEKLRQHFGLDQIILFGGSWGTTLALAYAETYPEHVSGMILRGVFTAARNEIDYFYHGGAAYFFPDAYDKLLAALPDPSRRPLPAYLFELIQNSEGQERDKYCKAWAKYETKMAVLEISDEWIDYHFEQEDPYVFALFENYYMANNCFLGDDQLLKNTDRIQHIRTVIVNGRYDAICPLKNAYTLHKKLPNSTLVIAERAGHWMGDEPVQNALLKAVKEFEQ